MSKTVLGTGGRDSPHPGRNSGMHCLGLPNFRGPKRPQRTYICRPEGQKGHCLRR
ncbi:uncharacterized protein LY79DRAFT_565423 [Colletotrichum navitas]|uniref:Uncharacterized protein n=1 Tax=Colletotrichum navitas TaxID=681940 RepID=A0AAD8PS31_9PEZI|nr:uncharacterized protein LY79DRAFT_565423 [Colletotrichum navitas]KAK1574673.1 hypothetical protein LY79DRAFT_565423 [Colletotrichum navitas]